MLQIRQTARDQQLYSEISGHIHLTQTRTRYITNERHTGHISWPDIDAHRSTSSIHYQRTHLIVHSIHIRVVVSGGQLWSTRQLCTSQHTAQSSASPDIRCRRMCGRSLRRLCTDRFAEQIIRSETSSSSAHRLVSLHCDAG